MNAKNFESFPCIMCGADVHLAGGNGRTRLVERNVEWPIPDDFELPTCSGCGEIYYSPEFTEPLDRILEEEYAAHQASLQEPPSNAPPTTLSGSPATRKHGTPQEKPPATQPTIIPKIP